MSSFNVFKYGGNLEGAGYTYTDSSDSYANNVDTVISFQHVPSGQTVYFKAFITAFNDTFSPDWAQEQVYGRGDPIVMFKQTSRTITLAFKVPAASAGEAYENLARVQQLSQFLYPTYMSTYSAQTITQSPLVRVKVMNLLRKNTFEDTGDATSAVNLGVSYSSTKDAAGGVLAAINNLTINHNLEGDDGVVEAGKNTVLPKLIDVNMDFLVIHEHQLGWPEGGNAFSVGTFPYGASLQSAASDEFASEQGVDLTAAEIDNLTADIEFGDTLGEIEEIAPEEGSTSGGSGATGTMAPVTPDDY